MLKNVLEILKYDTFSAIEFLNQHKNPKKAIDTYGRLVMHFYWKKKDLPRVVCIASAGIQFATQTARATQSENPELAKEFLSAAKTMAYNLASFTWSGWNEADITIGPTDAYIGLEAAKTNLRLAKELDREELPLCRAHWMLGAHYLASGLSDKAKQQFFESAGYAHRAQVPAEELLAIGYSVITTLSETPNDEAASYRLAEVKSQLESLENGQDFIRQLDMAMRLFVEEVNIEF
jgi:hypothetical protein